MAAEYDELMLERKVTEMTFQKFADNLRKVERYIAYVSGIFVLAIMFMIVGDVLFRNVLQMPLTGIYERVQYYCMPLIVLPSMAYVYSIGVIPRFDGLVNRATPAVQKIVAVLVALIEIVVFLLMTIYAWQFAMNGLSDGAGISIGGQINPIYPIYFLCPAGFALLLLEIVVSKVLLLQSFGKEKNEGK